MISSSTKWLEVVVTVIADYCVQRAPPMFALVSVLSSDTSSETKETVV